MQVLRLHLEYPRPLLPGQHTRYGRVAQEMSRFMHPRKLEPGEVTPCIPFVTAGVCQAGRCCAGGVRLHAPTQAGAQCGGPRDDLACPQLLPVARVLPHLLCHVAQRETSERVRSLHERLRSRRKCRWLTSKYRDAGAVPTWVPA